LSQRKIEPVIGDSDAFSADVVASFNGFTQRRLIEEFTDAVDGRLTAQSGMGPMPVPVMLPFGQPRLDLRILGINRVPELLPIRPLRPFDLAVQVRGAGRDRRNLIAQSTNRR
jgi:hypothetical protein